MEAIPTLRQALAADVRATYDGDPAAKSFDEVIFSYPGIFAITVYRIAHLLLNLGVPLLPPSITDFAAYIEKDVLCVTGFVVDDKEVEGLIVRFGGEIEGMSASVDEDGFFELLLEVPRDFEGVVYAQTTDTDGLDSELVSAYVD